MVLSNEPTPSLEYHIGTAAERHPVSQCSLEFCGMRWHRDQPGVFSSPEIPKRFEIPTCAHEGGFFSDLFPQHFFDCLRPDQQRVALINLRELARRGSECRTNDHETALEHIGTDAGVDDAIRASHRADGNEGLITGWVVLASVSQFDADGTDRSGVHRMFPDGSMPWVQALGIVEAARIQMHRDYSNGEA